MRSNSARRDLRHRNACQHALARSGICGTFRGRPQAFRSWLPSLQVRRREEFEPDLCLGRRALVACDEVRGMALWLFWLTPAVATLATVVVSLAVAGAVNWTLMAGMAAGYIGAPVACDATLPPTS